MAALDRRAANARKYRLDTTVAKVVCDIMIFDAVAVNADKHSISTVVGAYTIPVRYRYGQLKLTEPTPKPLSGLAGEGGIASVAQYIK